MARLKLLLAFLSLVILAAGVVGVVYYWKNYLRPNWEVTREFEAGGGGKDGRELPDLGLRDFAAAEDLLVAGEPLAARDRLLYLLSFYPESKSVPQAKEIIGEINLDLLLSRAPLPGKGEHVVKSGDLLAPIARKYQTSINYMMRAGGRTNHVIYPGDRLVVYPLNFKLRISLGKKTISIHTPEEDQFFKEYQIQEINLPKNLKAPASTKIADMVAWHDGKMVNFESIHYFEANKWIRTGLTGLFIRPHQPESGKKSGDDSASEENSPFGLMVDPADLEEMFTYLRPSNAVTLTP